MKRTLLIATVAAVMLSACGGGSDLSDGAGGTGTTGPSATAQPGEVTTIPAQVPEPIVLPTQGGQVQSGEVPQRILETILQDAAERTDVAPNDIEVVLGQFVIWADGSLGCPEPGMVYTQALVEGYRVVVDAAGRIVDYRVTESGSFKVCEQGAKTPSGLG